MTALQTCHPTEHFNESELKIKGTFKPIQFSRQGKDPMVTDSGLTKTYGPVNSPWFYTLDFVFVHFYPTLDMVKATSVGTPSRP